MSQNKGLDQSKTHLFQNFDDLIHMQAGLYHCQLVIVKSQDLSKLDV